MEAENLVEAINIDQTLDHFLYVVFNNPNKQCLVYCLTYFTCTLNLLIMMKTVKILLLSLFLYLKLLTP